MQASLEMDLTAKVGENVGSEFNTLLNCALNVQISMSALLMELTTVPDHLMEHVPIL